ncbi:3-oxoadipate enol-lactonase 2 [bacterium BMS3Abin04]|nr:3-oxoadipate enol-lactonase 2 [bacterium BMS3Abin04]
MKTEINGLSVYLSGDDKNQSLIFVHGFPYDHTMWDAQVNALSDKYFCITYDIRGLGESYVGDGQYTMEAFVWDLYSIIDELNLEQPVICGLSMGGYISLRAVEKEQKRFKALILLDTRSESDDNVGKLKRANAINKINIDGLDAYVDNFVPLCFSKKTIERNSDMFYSILSKCKSNNPVGVKGSQIAMLSRTDTTLSLKKIKIPTLVLVGKNDTLTSPEVMKKLAKKIKSSKFHIVPKAGHMTPLENPEYVNKKIRTFLDKKL